MKVKLLVDLKKYHDSLNPGIEGNIIGPYGPKSKQFPNAWVGVKFDSITLDVLRKHLEPVKGLPYVKKEGPVLEIQSETPPKIGDKIDFSGIIFKVESLVERLDDDLWLVNVLLI